MKYTSKYTAILCVVALFMAMTGCGGSVEKERISDIVVGEYKQVGPHTYAGNTGRTIQVLNGSGTQTTLGFEAIFKPEASAELADVVKLSVAAIAAALSFGYSKVDLQLNGTEEYIEAGQSIKFYLAAAYTAYRVSGSVRGENFRGLYYHPKGKDDQKVHWAHVIYDEYDRIVIDTRLPELKPFSIAASETTKSTTTTTTTSEQERGYKGYYENADKQVSLKGWDITPIVFTPAIKDCQGFWLDYTIDTVTPGDRSETLVNNQFCIMIEISTPTGAVWTEYGYFRQESVGETTSWNCMFLDSPLDFPASATVYRVAVVPSKSIEGEISYTATLDVEDITVS